MAEALKDQFGIEIPCQLADTLTAVFPSFEATSFVRTCLVGYEPLSLLARAHQIAANLHRYLPPHYPDALEILLRSLGPRLESVSNNGMAPFFYLPHTFFVARFGLDHFEPSMQAQYELTQCFTAEFSIRAYLERHPEATFARLREWTTDPSVHVRRLVSEGTRPRLPWASRIRSLQLDPGPGIELLERLKDDPDLYVRRSVANHLNDIGKDHPARLIEIAARWLQNATSERKWIINRALRSLIKQGNATALAVLGFQNNTCAEILQPHLTPSPAQIGGAVNLSFTLRNTSNATGSFLVDFRIFFVKASGRAAPKVFKLQTIELGPGAQVPLSKRVSLAQMSTRQHYPGHHRVEVLVNGEAFPAGAFELLPSDSV
jgi:3-methyladenine DNA glycosylase AlkC